jgi:hypothetical protein
MRIEPGAARAGVLGQNVAQAASMRRLASCWLIYRA